MTLVLALFTIVFAELVPKTLALAHAERFALSLSLPIDFLARALGPVDRHADVDHEPSHADCSAPR